MSTPIPHRLREKAEAIIKPGLTFLVDVAKEGDTKKHNVRIALIGELTVNDEDGLAEFSGSVTYHVDDKLMMHLPYDARGKKKL